MTHRRTAAIVLLLLLTGAGLILDRTDAAPSGLAAALIWGPVAAFAFWLLLSGLARGGVAVARAISAGTDRITAHPRSRALARRHPRVAGFLRARLDPTRPGGLTATLLSIVFVYVLALYLESVHDMLRDGAVAGIDTRLANLVFALRDDTLIALFSRITAFGSWRAVLIVLVGASAALVVVRRAPLLVPLWVTVIGNQLTVTLAKAAFARPRSALGYFVESSASFPSGHAASSVAIWGMLFYLAWRVRLLSARITVMAGLAFALLLGGSRIYLVVHYLSDVVNGWLVGAMWLLIGISICEWRIARRVGMAESRAPAHPRRAVVMLIAAIAGAGVVSIVSDPARNPAPEIVSEMLDPAGARALPQKINRDVTWLDGRMAGRIDLLVAAPDIDALAKLMRDAGWGESTRPGPMAYLRNLWSDPATPEAPIPWAFWNDRPNLLGFRRSSDGAVAQAWSTRRQLAEDGTLFALAVTWPARGRDAHAQGLGADLIAAGARPVTRFSADGDRKAAAVAELPMLRAPIGNE